jgi:phospholipase/lecithinase/hemolysin
MAYSGVFVFGDSLIDAGNALKLAQWYGGLPFTDLPEGAPTSDLGYFQGRFTNGYTFADLLSNKAIGLATKPVFPYGFDDPVFGLPIDPFASDPSGHNLNFAYGGAQIRQGDEVVPDLDGQTDAFKDAVDNHADPNALYLFTIGGNDVRSLAPSGSNPIPLADGHATLDAAAEKMLHEIEQLVDIGAHHILITGIPDVGIIPKYDIDANGVLDGAELARSAAATDYSIYLDTLIRTEIVPALQALGASVSYVPLMDYHDSAGNLIHGALSLILPEIAALHGLTAAELSQNLLAHQDLVFFDQVHPTAQAHALVGAYSYSLLTGTAWIENLPLTGADVDYRSTATIGAASEVDRLVVALVAGTTYTFEMLGISSLGTAGSLADPSLRLLGANGSVVATDADSGAGFDATLTFTAASSGNYTVELSATGALTGSYAAQAAVVSGVAMQSGNTYTVSSASTLVLEGAGGLGQDIVKAGVSYALSAGSEIEVLRTTSDKGKTAIDLTGNDFDQAIVGNAGSNVIDGKGGADDLWGGGGNDRFVLGTSAVARPDGTQVDHIRDYGKGDIVDVTQILSVASSVNVTAGGYLRVTNLGLIQVDLDGGGNNWVTLSTVNGNGAVAVRYLSGGSIRDISVSRTADVVSAAVAAAGLVSAPAASDTIIDAGPRGHVAAMLSPVAHPEGQLLSVERPAHSPESMEIRQLPPEAAASSQAQSHSPASETFIATSLAAAEPTSSPFLQGTDLPSPAAFPEQGVTLPSAIVVQALAAADAVAPKSTGEVGRVLADALDGSPSGLIDALLHGLPGGSPVSHFAAYADPPAEPGPLFAAHPAMLFEAMAIAPDAAAIA